LLSFKYAIFLTHSIYEVLKEFVPVFVFTGFESWVSDHFLSKNVVLAQKI